MRVWRLGDQGRDNTWSWCEKRNDVINQPLLPKGSWQMPGSAEHGFSKVDPEAKFAAVTKQVTPSLTYYLESAQPWLWLWLECHKMTEGQPFPLNRLLCALLGPEGMTLWGYLEADGQTKEFLQNHPERSIAVNFFMDIYRWEIKWKEEGEYGVRLIHSPSMERGNKEEGCGWALFWGIHGMHDFFFQNFRLSWTFQLQLLYWQLKFQWEFARFQW